MKYSIILICFICFLTSCSSLLRSKTTNKNFKNVEITNLIKWEKFYWSSDTILGKYNEKVAIYLPVKIKGIEDKISLQLDLGSSRTEFYGKTFSNLKSTIKDSLNALWNVELEINNSKGFNKKIFLYPKLGELQKIENNYKFGNLGHDYFQNKILVLDYKNEQFIITNNLEDNFYKDFFEIKNSSINKFPIIIPIKINKKNSKIMFDTGSSIFEFMTYPEKFNELKNIDTEIVEKCCIIAFGKEYTLKETMTKNSIEIFGKKFNELKISTSNKFAINKQAAFGMKLLRIYGITGNTFLNDNVIILNFRENRLWIK